MKLTYWYIIKHKLTKHIKNSSKSFYRRDIRYYLLKHDPFCYRLERGLVGFFKIYPWYYKEWVIKHKDLKKLKY